jgi:hypothetical protein
MRYEYTILHILHIYIDIAYIVEDLPMTNKLSMIQPIACKIVACWCSSLNSHIGKSSMMYVKKYLDMLISVLMSQTEHDTSYCL